MGHNTHKPGRRTGYSNIKPSTVGFFFLAFLIGIYSIHRLAMVKEEGEVEEEIVINQLISEVERPLRNFSTAGGLYQMVQFPFSIVRTTFVKAKVRKNRRRGVEKEI
ncbi:MAG: hypothetical protein GIS02_02070 [Methanosarcinales archaeon]|uniref:Transmembrane protein n=1 Tax=Candidatus Ethanoperedens thermophilum TaxID=2766897 RepID=A0A848D8T9_9EURY|nr:hypothetical protein [Candidatus Ethanoperedens thermophilum]